MLRSQMVPFDTPAILSRHSSHRVDHCRLVIDCILFRRHLVSKETCISWLVFAILWIAEHLLLCLLESLFVAFVERGSTCSPFDLVLED